MSYTVSFGYMTDKAVREDNPFIVREVYAYEEDGLKAMGLVYATETEALLQAKRMYWTSKAYQLASEPGTLIGKQITPWAIAYDPAEKRLQIVAQTDSVGSDIAFGSMAQAEAALQEIGQANWARYVLGLRGVELLVPTAL